MSYCEDCGCRLRDSGRCGWCQEEAVIYYEQSEYWDKNIKFSNDFINKVREQEKRQNNHDKHY